MAAAETAELPELFPRLRLLRRDLVQRLVPEHAVSRNVAALRLGFAPGRDRAQNGQLTRFPEPRLEPEPGIRRIEAVGRRVGERRHFLRQPALPSVAFEPGGDLLVDDAEMGDVGNRVVVHLAGQGTARPVGETLRLVDRGARQLRDQFLVSHLIAEAANHRRDLGVEDRRGDMAVEVMEDLDVLARGMEHLEHAGIAHQGKQRGQIDIRRQRVHRRRLVRRGELHQAETRPEGAVPHEFGVDGDGARGREPFAQGAKGPGVGDEMHGRVYTRFRMGGKATPEAPCVA